jgi:hypothetical protein
MRIPNPLLQTKLAIFKSKSDKVPSTATVIIRCLKAFILLTHFVMHFGMAENVCRMRQGYQ